ncbi:Serine/threonine-protein kinase ppk33 [Lasiodiplodia theobromae]|uniref:Serine/threonine-protein kinase ppk33 n=1 Tax=Lasiodiplodia theobromae TaxID=45133 RepID=A0A5N5DMF3_9PEZI|nr:Serine/threonine-protein kinase ppk33 [Lasiodiplodia theobromae]
MSVSNFRDDRPWDWPARSPPSPSASSSSSASRSMTPTSNNPWASSVSVVLPDSVSSAGSPPPRILPCPTPPSLSCSVTPTASRCATPVAPQPLSGAKPAFITMSSPAPPSPTDDTKKKSLDLVPAPIPTPNPFRESIGVSLAPLFNATITPALEKQYVHRESPTLISRQGWERTTGQRAYTWALGNSKTALLFLMCDDIAAWRRASFYWLEDTKLPFQEADLEGIATNPKKVVENQWRVLTRELPQNGQHTDFNPRDIVPLKQVGVFSHSGTEKKTVDKVRWMGDDNGRVFVRKCFTFERHAEKLGLLSQIQKLKTLEHPNVAKILCSYSQSATIGIVTMQAQITLEEYLRHPMAATRPGLLLTWINDLTQALAYIHSMDMMHQAIRPNKILLDGAKIVFSTFGISTDGVSISPRGSPRSYSGAGPSLPTNNSMRPLSEAAYIYAAPEVAARHGQGHRYRTSADIFSLGCVFLEMLTVAKGQTVSNLRGYRSQFSRDQSFHANLDRVTSWRKLLCGLSSGHRDSRINSGVTNGNHPLKGSGAIGTVESRKEDEAAEYQALECVGAMMNAESARRPKMRRLAPAMQRLDETRTMRRRRSFDAGDAAHVPSTAPAPIAASIAPAGGAGLDSIRRRWGSTAEKGIVTEGSLISF